MEPFSSSDLRSLVGLLNLEGERDAEDDDYEYSTVTSNCNPHYVAQKLSVSQNEKNIESHKYSKTVEYSKNIWADDEILDEEDDEINTKDKPEYEMVYQQSVTPDDVFLQLSGKGPGTDSCNCLLTKIKLPGIQSKDEVHLNISTLKLICKTKRHYLNLDLPKEVDPVKCSAKWDQTESCLLVKLIFDTDCKLNF